MKKIEDLKVKRLELQVELRKIDVQMEELIEQKNELSDKVRNIENDIINADYQFRCSKCLKICNESAYCVAQRASGYDVIHTCDCGNKTHLRSYEK